MSLLLKSPRQSRNLFIMMSCWTCAAFNFYLIQFYLGFLPGNIYQNASVSATAEIIANVVSAILLVKLGLKYSLLTSYFIAGACGLALLWFNDSGLAYITLPLILGSKFGINSAFSICYISTAQLFPTLFMATVFGMCNIVARTFTIMAPIVAEMDLPYPLLIYSSSTFMIGIVSLLLQEKAQKEKKPKGEKL